MKMRRMMIVLAALLALGASHAPAQNEPLKRTVLQQADLSNLPGHQGVLYKAEIGPGASIPKHTHPGDEFVYVVQGSLIVEPEGHEPVTLKEGESFRMPMGHVHQARNAGSVPAVLIAFTASAKGAPLVMLAE